MPGGFPAEVSRFIAERLNSVAELEVLLLLRGNADQDWCADEVAQALYTTTETSSDQLAELQSRGLLSAEGAVPRYRYSPQSPELAQIVEQLAEVYRERRVSVISLIYSKPVDKVQTFADAFRIRKEE